MPREAVLEHPDAAPGGSAHAAPAPHEPIDTERLDALRADASLIALINIERPMLDEAILCRGLRADSLRSWLLHGVRRDAMLAQAMREGVSVGRLEQSALQDAALSGASHIVIHALPESLPGRRWWLLAIVREKDAPTSAQIDELGLLLRQCQARFNRPREIGLGRLLAGGDWRVIHADPFLLDRFTRLGVSPQSVLEEYREVCAQRWPDPAHNDVFDVVLNVRETHMWIRSRRHTAVDDPRTSRHMIEIRPLERDELPAVGRLADERIAQALGYIHLHFHESPSLSKVAAAAHVSAFHFQRMFTRQISLSPKRYVQLRQLQWARWRLRTSRIPIGTIAREAGFANPAHFASTFRRMNAMSPTTYREQATH